MTGLKRIKRRMAGGIAILALAACAATAALAEMPSRLEVLYADTFIPYEMEADVMEVNYEGGYIVVAEQRVFVVTEEMSPPVTRTQLLNPEGKPIDVHAIREHQRVFIEGLEHPSEQVVALKIQVLKKGTAAKRLKKKSG